MFRRYSLILVMLAVLAAGVYAAWHLLWAGGKKTESALSYVPSDACVVVTGENLFALRQRMENTSLLWQEIRSTSSELLSPGFLDLGCSLLQKGENTLPFAWSLHAEGRTSVACMMSVAVGEVRTDAWQKTWKTVGFDVHWGNEEKTKFTLTSPNIEYYGQIENDLVIFTTTQALMDNVLAQHTKGTSVINEPGFTRISSTGEEDAPVHIYFRHRSVLAMLGPVLNKGVIDSPQSLADLEKSYWDVDVEADAVSFNGFIFSGHEMNSAVDVMMHQQPIEPRILKWLPENTTEFLYLGYSSRAKFLDNVQVVCGRQEMKNNLDAFNQRYDCNLERHLLSWLDNEMMYFNTGDSTRLLIMKVDETAKPQEELNFLSQLLDSAGGQNVTMNDIVINRLDADDIFVPLFGSFFSLVDKPYYLQIENVVVFSTTLQGMQSYIDQISNDRRFIRNAMIYDDLHHYFSTACNIMYHKSNSGNAGWSQWFNPFLSVESVFPASANITSITCQVSNSNKGMYYSSALLKHRQSGQTLAMPTIFEVALEKPVRSVPCIVPNHITGSHSIMVQDVEFNLYAISSTGKTEWKMQLDEPMVGEIQSIDIFGNGKYQVVVATKNQLHVIDLKGNYVTGFPVKITDEVTAAPAVMDYEGNHNYRFLVACGNKIHNIDKDGKPVKGFAYEGTSGIIKQRPLFMRANGKDYLFVCDSDGNVQFLDRKGKIRYPVSFALKDRLPWPVLLEPGKTPETTRLIYTSKLGRMKRVFLSGALDSLPGYRVNITAGYGYTDVDLDGFGDFIFADSGRVCVAGTDYKLKNSFTPSCNKFELYIYTPAQGEPVIAGRCTEDESIFAFDARGNSLVRTRLKTDKPFVIGDLNKDNKPEIIYTSGDRLFVYSIR